MRLIKIGIAFGFLITLTGCWSRVEINEQAFIFALYIDKGKEKNTVEVTVSTPLPNRLVSGQQVGSGGGQGAPYAMVTRSGSSIPKALNHIQRDLTRRLDFSHTRVIVVGREYSEEGIGELLNWIQRERFIDLSTYIMQSSKSARSIAELTPIYETMPSFVLRRFAIQNHMIMTKAKDCLLGHLANTGFPLIYLSSEMVPMIGDKNQPERWAGQLGLALFQKDRFRGALELEDSQMLGWAGGGLNRPVFDVSWDGGASRASVLFKMTKSYKEARMGPSGPLFTVKLNGTGDIISLHDIKKRKPEEIRRIIVRELNDQLHSRLMKALRKTQELGTDVLQFGNILEADYPEAWKSYRSQWERKYSTDTDFAVKLHLDIHNAEAAATDT